MPISPYLRRLRSQVGTTRLLLPSVSAHIFDASGRLLLVRQSDLAVWSTPGGLVEPDERPADAVVRETWEETGLVVRPVRVSAVFGGPEFIARYANGDESQYVIVGFECEVLGGELRPDQDETVDARYWSADEAPALQLAPWLRNVLPLVYERSVSASFEPPQWTPPPAASDVAT